MRFEVLKPGLFAVTAETQQEIGKALLRFQENFESPKFRNKRFTLKEFKAWYKIYRGTSNFTYYDDWGGFNFPDRIVERFTGGKFGRLSKNEKWLLNNISKAPKSKNGTYYVIGYPKNAKGTIKHEKAHAKFYLNADYRHEVLKALGTLRLTTANRVMEHIADMGYAKASLIDELHAYTLTEKTYLKEQGLWNHRLEILKGKLADIYRRYS